MTIITAMVKVYANLVDNKRRTLESLPEVYKQPVQNYIDSQKQTSN